MPELSEHALESRARRAAKKAGLMAKKSRWRAGTMDNFGGFQIVDPYQNLCVAGARYEMSAEQVIEYCNETD